MNNIILILMLNHHIRHHKARCSDGGVSPLEAGKYRWFCESFSCFKGHRCLSKPVQDTTSATILD